MPAAEVSRLLPNAERRPKGCARSPARIELLRSLEVVGRWGGFFPPTTSGGSETLAEQLGLAARGTSAAECHDHRHDVMRGKPGIPTGEGGGGGLLNLLDAQTSAVASRT